jgi:hypothetical protein
MSNLVAVAYPDESTAVIHSSLSEHAEETLQEALRERATA